MREHPYDKLKDHKYEKGILKSPMNQINYIKNYSWKKECFPDFIWIALILDYYGRKPAFLILSFSSISIIFQSRSILSNYKINIKKTLIIKLVFSIRTYFILWCIYAFTSAW